MARRQKDRIFQKTVTRPLPKNSRIIRRPDGEYAKCIMPSGETREFKVNDSGRIITFTETWYARYLGLSGKSVEVSLETSDEKLAMRKFLELTKNAALVRSGEITQDEFRKSELGRTSIRELVSEFGSWMIGKGRTKRHVHETQRVVEEMLELVGWKTVGQISRREMVKAVVQIRGTMSERSRQYRCNALSHFGRYLTDEVEFLVENPFRGMYSNKTEDRRHVRRALTVEEISVLLEVAESRSLIRADTYRILLMTGLRVGELTTLKVEDVFLNISTPYIKLKSVNEKNRKGSTIPLEPKVADLLRKYVSGKAKQDLVIQVPQDLRKRLRGDLKVAKIPQHRIETDKDGVRRRLDVIDVHSFRCTYCTLMAQSGVPLVVAQKRMRHSTPALTSNVYSMLTDSDLIKSQYQIGGLIDSHSDKD